MVVTSSSVFKVAIANALYKLLTYLLTAVALALFQAKHQTVVIKTAKVKQHQNITEKQNAVLFVKRQYL